MAFHDEEMTLAQKILAALKGGNAAFQNLVGGELGEGEQPSGRDFTRASQPRDGSPQGVFAHANRFFDDRARGRVAEGANRREQSAAESLIALQESQGRNLDSLALNRPARIDLQRELAEIKNINTDEESAIKRERLEFDKVEAQRTGDRENFVNATNALRALTERDKVRATITDRNELRPSEVQENLGNAAQGFGAGASSQANADTRQQVVDETGRANLAQEGTNQFNADTNRMNAESLREAREAVVRGDATGQQIEWMKAVGGFIKDTGTTDAGLLQRLGVTTAGPIEGGVREAATAGLEAAVAPPVVTAPTVLSEEQALEFLNQANGDRDEARRLAKEAGFTF